MKLEREFGNSYIAPGYFSVYTQDANISEKKKLKVALETLVPARLCWIQYV